VGILHARKAFHVAAGIHLAVLAASIPVYRVAVERAGLVGAANATLGLRLANCALLGAAAFVAVRGASPGSAAGTRGGGKAK
jgi:hypothetical protein